MDAALIGFLCSVPGLTVVLLLWAWWRQRTRRRALELVRPYRCCRCGASFEDAMLDYAGPPPVAGLDRFQRRFAAFTVRCLECDAVNVCTRDGTPFRAIGGDVVG